VRRSFPSDLASPAHERLDRIHLKQSVGMYLFALPFTMIQDLGWGMIPIVTVVAFTFMGIEGIADEIEMPFGTDKSDLPLDTYCADLKEEIECVAVAAV
jgi:ion channel-forming bestrophin family protein